MSGVLPLARKLGELLDAKPIPEIEPINTQIMRCTRKDIWPPEALAEMNAIWIGETA